MKRTLVLFLLLLLPLQLLAAGADCYGKHSQSDSDRVSVVDGADSDDSRGLLGHDESECGLCQLLSSPSAHTHLDPVFLQPGVHGAVPASDEQFNSADIALFDPPPLTSAL